MEKNIFANAKFGDKFLTRTGKIALYIRSGDTGIHKFAVLLIKDKDWFIRTSLSGSVNELICGRYESDEDIVARYHEPEPIHEEELDELAKDSDFRMSRFNRTNDWTRDDYYREGFKAGYRKAKEE